jgi:hypothetical protein
MLTMSDGHKETAGQPRPVGRVNRLAVFALFCCFSLAIAASAASASEVPETEWQSCVGQPQLSGPVEVTGGVECGTAKARIKRFLSRFPHEGIQHLGEFYCRARNWYKPKWEIGCQRGEGRFVFAGTLEPPVLLLSIRGALNAIAEALRERLGSEFPGGYGECRFGAAQNIRRCRFSWYQGDSYYWGRARVRLDSLHTGWVRGSVRRLDEYCLRVEHKPRRRCVKRIAIPLTGASTD